MRGKKKEKRLLLLFLADARRAPGSVPIAGLVPFLASDNQLLLIPRGYFATARARFDVSFLNLAILSFGLERPLLAGLVPLFASNNDFLGIGCDNLVAPRTNLHIASLNLSVLSFRFERDVAAGLVPFLTSNNNFLCVGCDNLIAS